jgi:hypothetical protein
MEASARGFEAMLLPAIGPQDSRIAFTAIDPAAIAIGT